MEGARTHLNRSYAALLLKRGSVCLVVLFVGAAIVLMGLQSFSGHQQADGGIGQNWMFADGSAAEFPLRITTKDGQVRVYTNLPSEGAHKERTIAFFTKQAAATVLLNGNEIYKAEFFESRLPLAPASQWNVVTIPAGSGGEQLELILDGGDHAKVIDCGKFICGAFSQVVDKMIAHTIGAYAVSWVLFIIGLFFLVAHYLLHKELNANSLQYLGAALLFYAVYGLSASGMYGNFLSGSIPGMILGTASFLLFYIPFLLYCRDIYPKKRQPWLLFITYAFLGLGAAAFILWLCGVMDLFLLTIIALFYMTVTGAALIIMAKGEKQLLPPAVMMTASTGATFFLALFGRAESNNFFLSFGVILVVAFVLSQFIKEALKNIREKAAYQKQSERIYNQLMVSQIKPHFLYNVLSSVRTLIKTDQDTAYKMTYDFTKYLRSSIDSIGNDQLISFREELNSIRAYLDIEQVRFAGKFRVEYDIQAEDFPVPMLTIEPLVENAVKHGLKHKSAGGRVSIRAYSLGSIAVVEVEDNGCGFQTKHFQEDFPLSAGLRNVNSRLHYYGNYELHIKSAPGQGTLATVLYIKERGKGLF